MRARQLISMGLISLVLGSCSAFGRGTPDKGLNYQAEYVVATLDNAALEARELKVSADSFRQYGKAYDASLANGGAGAFYAPRMSKALDHYHKTADAYMETVSTLSGFSDDALSTAGKTARETFIARSEPELATAVDDAIRSARRYRRRPTESYVIDFIRDMPSPS
ncbi:UNVERIFIED_ORG: hypothetical protein BCL66_105250 [Martelella mediterranea]